MYLDASLYIVFLLLYSYILTHNKYICNTLNFFLFCVFVASYFIFDWLMAYIFIAVLVFVVFRIKQKQRKESMLAKT